MTTLGQVDATLARFDRKSPRDAYKQVCEELELHYQRVIYNKLPEVPSAWHRVTILELDHTLLGPKGCKTLLPCVLVSTALRKLSLKSTGLTDEFVIALCDIFQTHPTIRSLNISENPLISVFSASSIISLIRRNSNMVEFDVSKTHVGDNVANIINLCCVKNLQLIATYFEDKYFKLKTTFDYLDVEGLGWVPLKSLVMNCPYPILQEQFIERIARIKPKKRSDNTISINTFLSLVYMNFKTEVEIAQYAKNKIDEPYVFMVANWKQILSAAERYNEENQGKVTIPQDLHRLRIKDLLLTNEEADTIIQTAVSIQVSSETNEDNFSGPNMFEGLGGSACVALSSSSLNRSARECIVYSENIRPVYQFYEERDVLKVSDVLMNGSRLLNMSALLGTSGTSTGGFNSRKSSVAGTLVDPDGPKHTWQLAPSVVAMVVEFFHKTVAKLPEKKESSTTELTAKERRVRAMEKKTIPVTSLFECSFETDFEVIRPHLLANYYSRFSIPAESAMITLQEVIIVMNELCTEISVDKSVSLEEIHTMKNPFEVPHYANFLANHLLEREEQEPEIEFASI